jgi:rapamycin-insensitive companion of mTOR
MKGRNDTYVEASLSRAFSVQTGRARSNNQEQFKTENLGTIPPHFYRELTRTAEGCQFLKESGHFHDFVAIIQESWAECEDHETMLKVKGCLWAVGNVGSMELGAPFLEETDAVALIVKIAENSGVTTIRGTAFFVLGLISRSIHGTEILLEHGWDTATDSLGRSLGYCLPSQLGKLFSAS